MPATLATPAARSTQAAARFAWLTVAFFILVVLWGAVVRATGSGGGCGSHWPLCNGYVNPLHHPRLATVIEFAHRQSTTVASCLMAALTVWTFHVTPRGHRARKAALWTIFFLILEALLGAALVLRHWVENNDSTGRIIAQAVHFTNTLLLMGALALTAWFLRPRPAIPHKAAAPRWAAWLAIAAAILTGATGALAALADTLFPSPSLSAALASDFAAGSPMLIRTRWIHPAASILLILSIVLLARSRSILVRAVIGLTVLQLTLGVADVLLLAPIWMQVLHLLGADLLWIALVLVAAEATFPAATIPIPHPEATLA